MTAAGSLLHMSASPSRSSSPALVNNPNMQIPFNSAPVQHAPSPLGFGFGFGSSFGGNNAGTVSSPTPLLSNVSTPLQSSSYFGNLSASPKRAEQKRRRDIEDDVDHDDDEDTAHISRNRVGSFTYQQDRRPALPKRMRAGLGFGPAHVETHQTLPDAPSPFTTPQHLHTPSTSASASFKRPALGERNRVGMSGIDVDIGKMLASMDRSALLLTVTSLLSQSDDPMLAARVLSLLPTPSLDSVEASLDELEKAIRSAIPFTADGNPARHQYTWSRLRAPVAAFADAVLGYLPFFVTELAADREQRLREQDPRLQASREEVHPATTFTFLHTITSRVLRIEAILPPVPKASLAFNLFTAGNTPASFGFGAGSLPASPIKSTAAAHGSMFAKHSDLVMNLDSEYTSSSSPDSLMAVLMPAVLKQWTILLHRLDRAVNVDGRMFSQEVVLAWARALETTGTAAAVQPPSSSHGFGTVKSEVGAKPEEVAIRQAMDQVRNRLERDLAWLVRSGYTPVSSLTHDSTMKSKRRRSSGMSDTEEEL